MKKILIIILAFVGISGLVTAGFAEVRDSRTGEELFKENCALCHPDGKNIINPEKSLWKKDREANNIFNKADIVYTMRHPGKGMTFWSASTLPDSEAEKIADYIMTTFK
jgi:cytochrome c6